MKVGGNPSFRIADFSPTNLTNWRFGAYGGQINQARLLSIEWSPWSDVNKFSHGYMAALDATVNLVKTPYLPITIGVDLNVSQHFGQQTYYEVAAAPTVTWDWFPWNNYVYTRYRIGPLGGSYDTALSRSEATETSTGKTSRFLNYHVSEWIFSPSKDSKWEVFIGVHHRCGIYGLIDHVDGGENYVTAGWRAGF